MLDRVSELLDKGVTHEFAAKAAVYARDRFNMRSVSHVVAGELAGRVKGSDWIRPFVRNVIVRVDDMLEMAYYEGKCGRKPVPNALNRSMRDAFAKFDGYQLAKYRGGGRGVNLVDIVNLVHPEPTGRNREALRQLVEGKLRSTETWESRPIKIASLFAAVLLKANPSSELMMFSSDARYMSVNTDDTLLTIQRQTESRANAGGTNFRSVFRRAKRAYDRIVIMTDMQGWMEGGAPTKEFADYRKRTGADPHVYSFDLQGYGTLMFPERNVYALAGFSEKVFDVMALLERDREALVHEIEAITLA